nr:reverse transcriptase domain-containing protein [Tanacetum cinerariifolium]
MNVGNKMLKAFPLAVMSSHCQTIFPLLVKTGRAEVEEDDREQARFRDGKIFSGRKKSRGLNIGDSDNTGAKGKTVGGAIRACGGISYSLLVALYDKFNHKKEKNEKLKDLKARLNFKGCFETSRYSESKTMRTKEHDKRHRSRRSHSPRTSVVSRIRRERSRSPIRRERSRLPRQREKEGGVFKRLGSRGKSVSALSDSYDQHSHSRYTEALSESEDSGGGHWKSRSKKKKLSKEKEDLPQPWKKYIKDLIELHSIKQRDRESTEAFVGRYKLDSGDVKGAPECMRISGFMHGITKPELIKRLHDEILKKEYLSHLIKEIEQNNEKEQPKVTKKGETSRKDKANLFPPLGEDEGTKGPMIIEAKIGGYCVHRKTQLLVKIRDEEHSASAWRNFMVVRSQSPYNGIIERPGVKKLQEVPLTAHEMLKILVEGGVITLKSSKLVPLECAMVSGPGETSSTAKPIIEE